MSYLSKSEIVLRENDILYSYFEFVAIVFTCKLHILKFYSSIFTPLRYLPISRLFQHNEIGFWNPSKWTKTSQYFTPYSLFSHFESILTRKRLNNALKRPKISGTPSLIIPLYTILNVWLYMYKDWLLIFSTLSGYER